jgi:methylmalonyl-CoA mutase
VAWPHNRLIGESSVADARLGRNILQLMRYESYMHRVTDPAGGSRYVEQLTSQLANEGWRQFQEIESFGGYAESSDWLDKKMGEAMAGQHQDGATRKRSYVGVNNYPNPAEGLGPTIPDNDLRPIAAYERLRAAVEKLPDSPEAFIFMFGNRTMRNARNTFARNVIGILGLNATENKQADDWEASIEELKQRNPALICLCAADEDYSLLKTDELRRIMPKALIVVAGKEQAGLTADFFVYRGADILGVLTRLVAAVQD